MAGTERCHLVRREPRRRASGNPFENPHRSLARCCDFRVSRFPWRADTVLSVQLGTVVEKANYNQRLLYQRSGVYVGWR